MDLNTVTELVTDPRLGDWQPGDAWLAGGTWLFSEPQTHLRRLLDLTAFSWPALRVTDDGDLEIASTCTIAELYAFAPRNQPTPPDRPTGPDGPPPDPQGPAALDWPALPLFRQCCEAFLASFKIWNVATVGGNLGNSLPAGPMISLTAGLDGGCELWAPDGGRRTLDVVALITGDNRNALAPGEVIRSITLPRNALHSRTAFRQQSLTTLGRSAALLIGRLGPDGEFVLTVTASTVSPMQLRFPAVPPAEMLASAIGTSIPFELYHNDVHGLPLWRRHLTYRLAEQIRAELAIAELSQ